MCVFCRQERCEDSIEHIVHCTVVQDVLPDSMRRGRPSKIPVSTFFLLGLDGKQRIAMSLVIYALYTLHNMLRHDTSPMTPHEVRQAVYRIIAEVGLHPAFREAWNEILQWESRGFSRTSTRVSRRMQPHATCNDNN